MIKTALAALLSYWRKKPGQLATLLVGLSLATALWSGVQAINTEAAASYEQAASVLGQDQLRQLVREDNALIDQQVYIDVLRAGWRVTPLLEGQAQFGTVSLRVLGIEPLTMPPQAQATGGPQTSDLTAFITAPGLFYMNGETAARWSGQTDQPVRIIASIPPGTVMTDIGQAQTLLKAEGKISRMLLWNEQPLTRAPLETAAPGLIIREDRQSTDFARLTDSFHLNLTAFGYLSFVVGLFIVYSAVGLAFEQRRSLFRTLRALGLPVQTLVVLLICELMAMALIAGIVGIALGYIVAAFLLPDVAATLRGLYGVDVTGALSFRPGWAVAGIIIAVAGTLLSAAHNLWQVWHLPILAPAQPKAWARATQLALRWQAILALLLLAAALSFIVFGASLFAGFAALATMLFGAALLLPVILAAVLKAFSVAARGPLVKWFWADTRQQLPGQSIALMALLLALATNIGVGTMVSSFRLTFTGYLDQRLASELYVSGRTEEEAEAIRAWLTPRADAVLPIWNIDATVAGQPAEIFGVSDHATYRDNWPMLSTAPDAWDQLAKGEGVLINEQLSRRENLNVGDAIMLPGPWQPRIAGIYSDYGNTVGQVLIGIEHFNRRFPDAARLRFAVRVSPEKAVALAEELGAQFSLPPQNAVNQAELKRFSLDVFDRTFTVTAALNVLTLGVAGIAMFASLMTLADIRLPQLAPAWAMGMTRRNLAWLEFGRSLMLAFFTLIAALPLGLAMAWVLLSIINVEAFGWRLPLYLFPREWAVLGALGLIAAALAAALPVRRLARSSPSDLLRAFSNER